jgi:hypothetical protein
MYGYGYKYTNQKTSAAYDPDALAYFTLLGDVPAYAKNAWNAFVVGCKADGTWTLFSQVLPSLPSETMLNGLVDAKSLATTVTAYSNASTLIASPYLIPCVWTGSLGINFTLLGETRNGWIPSANWTLNSSAYAFYYPTEADSDSGYSFGTFQSATQSCAFIRRSATDTCEADMYGSTVGTGRARKTTAGGTLGTFIVNRTSNILFKIWKDGTAIATVTSTQGSLPTLQTRFNAYG